MLRFAIDPSVCTGDPYPGTCFYRTGPGIQTDDEYDPPIALWGPPGVDLGHIGEAVSHNLSVSLQVQTLESTVGPIAVMVVPPADISSYAMFTTQTFGAAASCEQNHACSYSVDSHDDSAVIKCNFTGGGPQLPRDIARSGGTNITITQLDIDVYDSITYALPGATNKVLAPYDAVGNNMTNPFGYNPIFAYSLPPNSTLRGIRINGTLEYSFYAGICIISIYEAELAYSNGSYTILNQRLADANTTTWLSAPFLQASSRIWLQFDATDTLANYLRAPDFSATVSAVLSHQGISYSAGLLKLLPTDVSSVVPFIGSRYPISSLAFLWTSAGLYVVLSLVLILNAVVLTGDVVFIQKSNEESNEAKSTSTLHLAHQRLSNPIAIVAEHFVLSDGSKHRPEGAPNGATLSVQVDATAMFPERSDAHRRLRVGFVGDDDDGLKEKTAHDFEAKGPVPFRIV